VRRLREILKQDLRLVQGFLEIDILYKSFTCIEEGRLRNAVIYDDVEKFSRCAFNKNARRKNSVGVRK